MCLMPFWLDLTVDLAIFIALISSGWYITSISALMAAGLDTVWRVLARDAVLGTAYSYGTPSWDESNNGYWEYSDEDN